MLDDKARLAVAALILRCSVRLRSVQSGSSTTNLLIHVFMDLALCPGVQSCWNRKWPAPNVTPEDTPLP